MMAREATPNALVAMVLFLDSQNHVIDCEEMFRGTLTQTSVYPREIVKRALFHNSAAVILAHNHPSGVAEPSRADETLTAALARALALVDVKVLLSVEKQKEKEKRQHAECSIHVKGCELFAECAHQDLYAAVDVLVDKLDFYP